MDHTEHKLQLAEAAGFAGDKAGLFASLLVGETEDELTESAARLVDLGKSLAPPPVLPVDPTQGLGDPPDRVDPGQWMTKQMDKIMFRSNERDPWTMSLGL